MNNLPEIFNTAQIQSDFILKKLVLNVCFKDFWYVRFGMAKPNLSKKYLLRSDLLRIDICLRSEAIVSYLRSSHQVHEPDGVGNILGLVLSIPQGGQRL